MLIAFRSHSSRESAARLSAAGQFREGAMRHILPRTGVAVRCDAEKLLRKN
jgi:hypothetical protein